MAKAGHIETGRWYDIKVEVKGVGVTCTLDGKVVHEIKNTLMETRGLFASATRADKSSEVIVKVVNAAATPTEADINLHGIRRSVGPSAIHRAHVERSQG